MHFEILIEDQSGKKMLDILLPKIVGTEHTFKVHPYNGIGRIPRNLNGKTDKDKRILLNRLPQLLRAYGNTFSRYPSNYFAAVIFVCDLDDKCLKAFRQELFAVLDACNPKPETRFCIAIEEGEAWFLGDISAIKAAYPKAKANVLNSYKNDAICGTWEHLANAIYPGGAKALSDKGWQAIGAEKSLWSARIAPHMDVAKNSSPSFGYFIAKFQELTELQRQ